MNATTTEAKTPTFIIPGKFNGVFKNWQKWAFGLLIFASISRKVAHKMCCDFASDLGRLMAEDSENFKAKIGNKLGSEGERSLKVVGAAKIRCSDAMSIIYVCQTMDELFRQSLLKHRRLPELTDKLAEYVSESEEWVGEQLWQEDDKPVATPES